MEVLGGLIAASEQFTLRPRQLEFRYVSFTPLQRVREHSTPALPATKKLARLLRTFGPLSVLNCLGFKRFYGAVLAAQMGQRVAFIVQAPQQSC